MFSAFFHAINSFIFLNIYVQTWYIYIYKKTEKKKNYQEYIHIFAVYCIYKSQLLIFN